MENQPTDAIIPAEAKKWDPSLYDAKHSFVWKYGEELIQLLAPKVGEQILDLGCGTGHLSHQISLSGAKVTGLDRSSAMIEQARKNYPELHFLAADAASFQFAERFDAVFSNAALHWMKRANAVAAAVCRSLKPGGRFIAEFGGKGNVKLIHGAIEEAMAAVGSPAGEDLNPWYFPSVGEYAGLLEKNGLAVTYAVLFDRPTPLEDGDNGLRHWIRMFAGEFLARLTTAQQQELMNLVEEQLRPTLFHDGVWFADYRRIRIVANRE